MNLSEKNKLIAKTKNKIVLTIMGILALVLSITLITILISTGSTIYGNNQEILKSFTIDAENGRGPMGVPDSDGATESDREMPGSGEDTGDRGSETYRDRLKNAAVLYVVKFLKTGEMLDIMNDVKPIMSDESLKSLARTLVRSGKSEGVTEQVIFRIMEFTDGDQDIVYVTMMDSSVMMDSLMALLRNTMIFGGAALAIFFIVSVYLAERIMRPMEEAYTKQRQFISDAGHELKTPVSAINANAEILKRSLGEDKWLDNIIYENDRMKELVTQLLELARTENTEPVFQDADFSRLAEGCILPFEMLAFEKGFIMESDIEPDIHLQGNEAQLGQLITTLTDNAISHASSSYGDDKIRTSLKSEGKNLIFRISNPGENIPKEELARLFERFYRSDSSRELNGHYGLGLAIAKAIADSHHGSISVVSENHRTCFTVSLPKI